MLDEGWYLMSTSDLERELARARGRDAPPSNALRLTTDAALAYRDAGNLPDEEGRTLRLVLHASDASDLASLHSKRLVYEPDYHSAPTWRGPGSKPVNVVPLRSPGVGPVTSEPWWEQPAIRELELEWSESGTVAGIPVPAEYRGFVYKTVLALQDAGIEITAKSVTDSIARWLPPDEVAELKRRWLRPPPSSGRRARSR